MGTPDTLSEKLTDKEIAKSISDRYRERLKKRPETVDRLLKACRDLLDQDPYSFDPETASTNGNVKKVLSRLKILSTENDANEKKVIQAFFSMLIDLKSIFKVSVDHIDDPSSFRNIKYSSGKHDEFPESSSFEHYLIENARVGDKFAVSFTSDSQVSYLLGNPLFWHIEGHVGLSFEYYDSKVYIKVLSESKKRADWRKATERTQGLKNLFKKTIGRLLG